MQHARYTGPRAPQRTSSPEVDPKRLRRRMVREQLEARGINDAEVLAAMG
ncbi:protein-L-isoaspartate O-methyltransferase, partial [Desulfovibrio sp. 1214_IL3152]